MLAQVSQLTLLLLVKKNPLLQLLQVDVPVVPTAQLPQLENNELQATHELRLPEGTRLELHAMHVAAVLPQVVQFTIVALQDTQAEKLALGTLPVVVQAVQVESPVVLVTLQVWQSFIWVAQGVHDLKPVAGTVVKSARHSWQSVL